MVLLMFQQPASIEVFAVELNDSSSAEDWRKIVEAKGPIKIKDDPLGLLDYRVRATVRGRYLLWFKFVQSAAKEAEALEAVVVRRLDAEIGAEGEAARSR
jgi:hypothetical protein